MTAAARLLPALAVLALCWPAGPAAAQVTDRAAGAPDALDAVEAALDSGRVERARELLAGWEEGDAGPTSGQAKRALYLRARLTADADSAETLYLDLALEGDARYGDRAWLRLAQLHLARGEPGRARAELERLRTDYPSSDLSGASWYWTGRAAAAAGDGRAACRAWRRAASDAEETAAELASRALEGCRDGTLAGYAVQLGAFRERARARELEERAREAGFEVRTVDPSSPDGLVRVRTGRVADREAAAELVRRLESEGFPAMVVELSESSG